MTLPAKRRSPAKQNGNTATPPAPEVPPPAEVHGHADPARRGTGPRSLEEAEEMYVAARDAWTAAMRAANSGRPADMASLGLTQEAYEAAAAERERWMTSNRIAVKVDAEGDVKHRIEAAVGHEIAWRSVRQHEEPEGFFDRLKRRFGRR